MLGFAAIGIAQASLVSMKSNSRDQLSIPRHAFALLATLLFAAFARGVLVSANVIEGTAVQQIAFSLVGKDLRQYSNLVAAEGLYMVTSPTCPPCLSAKAFNQVHALPVTELPVCSGFQTEDCFRSGSESVPTPTYFLVDAKGQVTWEFVGAPSSEMQSTFLAFVRASEKENDTHIQSKE